MKKILIFIIIMLISINKIYAMSESQILPISEGVENAKIEIIVYESLSCSHCAKFHEDVYPKLKEEFIDTGMVKIIFKHFPLDMAALNASKIAQCKNDGKSDLLHLLFKKQSIWLKGETLEDINKNLKSVLKEENIEIDFSSCVNNSSIEDFVLNNRIEGVKKFEVNSTPTIIINNKKFKESLTFKNLKKYIEKLI